MAIPGQTFTFADPGMGLVEAAPESPLVLGVSSAGTAAALEIITSPNDAIATFGQGPLVETICSILSEAGGPVLGMRMTGDGNAANGAVGKTAVGASTGTITLAGTANDAYELHVEITVTGTLGTGAFRYSLDDGTTWSDELIIPVGGTYLFPLTGITATFVPGAGPTFFEDGDLHEADVTCDHFDGTALAAGVTTLLASTREFSFMVLAGTDTSAANAATLFGALETQLGLLEADFVFTRAIMSGGTDTPANIVTAMNAVDNNRISVCGSTCDMTSSKPFSGWGAPLRPTVDPIAARAADNLISTDGARVASGSLTGVQAITRDEFLDGDTFDIARISALRTWRGRTGFYICNHRIKSAVGSDYRYWQHGRIMDTASRTIYLQQQQFVGAGIRTNSDGTIDERDALRLEAKVIEALRAQLTQPDNAEGTRGHVSEFSYVIDRTNNLATTETLLSEFNCRPLGYPKNIGTTLGFALAVAGS